MIRDAKIVTLKQALADAKEKETDQQAEVRAHERLIGELKFENCKLQEKMGEKAYDCFIEMKKELLAKLDE